MDKDTTKKASDFSTYLAQFEEMNDRREEFLTIVRLMAPGTPLRQGINYIVQAQSGGLILLSDIEDKALYEVGFTVDTEFTPHRLYELSKMDGAIILNSDATHIKYMNTHIHPDIKLSSLETGTRHRVAERFAMQTGDIAIAISQKRNTVTIYFSKEKYILINSPEIMSACSQALQTFDNYKETLKKLLNELTTREFRDTVQFIDLVEIINVIETIRKVEKDVERYIMELGSVGVLLNMRFTEMKSEISDYQYIVKDYCKRSYVEKVEKVKEIYKIYDFLYFNKKLDDQNIVTFLGYPNLKNFEQNISSRGYRVLSSIPRLPASIVQKLVDRFSTLPKLISASASEYTKTDGIAEIRSVVIKESLNRLRDRHLTERLLL